MGPFTATLSSGEFLIADDAYGVREPPIGEPCTIGIALRPTSPGSKPATLKVSRPNGEPAVADLLGAGIVLDASGVDAPGDVPVDASGESRDASSN